MMKDKSVLYASIIVFILLIAYFFIPFPENIHRASFLLVAVLGLLLVVLGIMLIFIARKKKGKLKLFLMIAGFSAVSPLIFSVLHNIFYALGIIFEDFHFLFEILHAASFMISLLISPITFIIGAAGSIILLSNIHMRKK